MNLNLAMRDYFYIGGILLAGASNFFVNFTEVKSDVQDQGRRLKTAETYMKETNVSVIVNRVDNMETQILQLDRNVSKLNEKTDRILLLLAGSR